MALETSSIVSVKLHSQIKEIVFSPLLSVHRKQAKIFQQPKSIFTERDDLFEQRI